MARKASATAGDTLGPVEIITDEKKIEEAEPFLTIRTGETEGKTFIVKINQPSGRALMIAVHL